MVPKAFFDCRRALDTLYFNSAQHSASVVAPNDKKPCTVPQATTAARQDIWLISFWMRQTEGSSPRNTWAHFLFCFVLFDIVICVISWLPLPVCLCRKLHGEMGEPHHVLCGQCVCSCRLIIDTHTHPLHAFTHPYIPAPEHQWPKTGMQSAPADSRGLPSAIQFTRFPAFLCMKTLSPWCIYRVVSHQCF